MSTETETPAEAIEAAETAETQEVAQAPAAPAPARGEAEPKDQARGEALDWAIAFTRRQPLGHEAIPGKKVSGAAVYSELRKAFGDRLLDHGVIHYKSNQDYLLPTVEAWELLLDECLDLDSRLQGISWLRNDLAWALRYRFQERASGSASALDDGGIYPLACGVLVDLPVADGRSCLNVLLSHDEGETQVWIVDPANGRRRPVDGSDRDLTVVYI